MAKLTKRTYSQYALEAMMLLGRLIRITRTEQKMTAQELADRAGISRGLLQRIEKGHPGCEIGSVFEVAAILGVNLFDNDRKQLSSHIQQINNKLALLPQAIHQTAKVVNDDF